MIRLKEISIQLGSIKEKNSDIEDLVDWSSKDIFDKTGIKTRYISTPEENTLDLAVRACQKLKSSIENIDFIISVTNTPLVSFPNLSYYIHTELCLNKKVKCVGINAGCTGYVDAIELAYSFIESGFYNEGLVVTSDTYTKYLAGQRSTRTLFSDGSSATIISKDDNGLIIKNRVSSTLSNSETYLYKDLNGESSILMDGPKVLHFALSHVTPEILELIPENENCTIVPHQAGKIVLSALSKKINGKNKILTNYENFGNLVSTSIPNLLANNMSILETEGNLLFSGFGVGLGHNAILLSRKS